MGAITILLHPRYTGKENEITGTVPFALYLLYINSKKKKFFFL